MRKQMDANRIVANENGNKTEKHIPIFPWWLASCVAFNFLNKYKLLVSKSINAKFKLKFKGGIRNKTKLRMKKPKYDYRTMKPINGQLNPDMIVIVKWWRGFKEPH
jgi:hypothetical protein